MQYLVSQGIFELNFTLPNADSFLGTIMLYIQTNDTEAGYTISSLVGPIMVLNNLPSIPDIKSNPAPSSTAATARSSTTKLLNGNGNGV